MGGALYLHRKLRLPDRFVLELDLTSAVAADTTLHDTVTAIGDAARDDRVCGLVAKLGGARLSIAQSQDLGEAVTRFRAAKASAPTLAFAEEFNSAGQYLLACSFETVVQQPGAVLRDAVHPSRQFRSP